MTTPPTNPHIEEHRRAGAIHIVEGVADLNRLLSAIQFELDYCRAPALVIDLIGYLCLTHGEALRLSDALADPRLGGRWEINVGRNRALEGSR